jgi:hypothetical protein
MSLYGAFDQHNHFSELGVPLESQGEGVRTPAQRRALAVANLFGDTSGEVGEAILFGIGRTADPVVLTDADGGYAIDYEMTVGNTSGEVQGLRVRLDLTGTAGSISAIAGVANVVNVAATTAYGGEFSVNISGATGSGEVAAARLDLNIAAASTTPVGPLSVLHLNADVETGVTLPAGNTTSFIRFTNSDSVLVSNLLNIPNAANGSIFAAHITQTMTHSIRIRSADGTAYYVMVTNAATNRS